MALIPYSPYGGEITLVLVALSKLYIKKVLSMSAPIKLLTIAFRWDFGDDFFVYTPLTSSANRKTKKLPVGTTPPRIVKLFPGTTFQAEGNVVFILLSEINKFKAILFVSGH